MSTLPEIKTILYATDLGRHMRPVFRHAISLAQHLNAQIIMLHVVEPMGSTAEAVISAYLPNKKADQLERDGMKKILKQMKGRLEDFCKEELELCDKKGAMVKEILVTTGRPADRIPQEAEKHHADMIIMGCKGNSGDMENIFFGSTTERVLRFIKCPVLCVPEEPNIGPQ